ncbi:DMT family transporter [Roseobacter sp. HKCCA0434]|uniref:DMT family transporter n=1 Tax=Roseobacter sp. HKCCA0434 TaxID=3079297 RepID=UPI00290593FB|nr:DMT family transporter [Roseobacter sp. HKCCA0434]
MTGWRLGGTVFAAMCLIVTGDTAGKLLTQGGVAPVFVAWSRFALAALVLLPVLGVRRGEWGQLLQGRVLLRGGLIAGGIACILTALRTEAIGTVFGAFFVGPVVAYVLSVLLLGERVSAARSALLALSFAGVMLVVKPGPDLSVGLGFALAAGAFYGCYLVATRWLAGSGAYRAGFLLVSQLLVGAVLLAPLGLGAWPAGIGGAEAGLIALSALASAGGNYILVRVGRTAPASRVAPLVYTQLIAAVAAGVVVFGDWPDPLALAGLGVILGAGLAMLRLAR